MELKFTQYIERTGIVEIFLFHFLLFLLSTYGILRFTSLENGTVEVSDLVFSKASMKVEDIEGNDLSTNYKFLFDRTTYWLG